MLWACFSAESTERPVLMKERMNGSMHGEILDEKLFQERERVSDRKHIVMATGKWLRKEHFVVLEGFQSENQW